MHVKMTVWTSVLWKINVQMAKKWTEMVVKWPFMSQFYFESDYISNDSEPNPKSTKRLSPDKFFSWFTFVKFSVMYFYLLFRCKKMIAFHSCPRDILVTSKRILREKKKWIYRCIFWDRPNLCLFHPLIQFWVGKQGRADYVFATFHEIIWNIY